MARTVAKLIDGVSGLLTGTDLNNVTNLFNAFERAFRIFLQRASVPEASTSQIVTLYDGVFNYSAPSTIFGGALRDFRPLGLNRTPQDFVYRRPIEYFDRTKCVLPNGTEITFEFENGVSIMRVAQNKAVKRIILDPMNATTGWASGGSASAVVVDQSFYYQLPASLRFNLTGNSTGYIEKTLTTPINLTSYQGVGVVFLALEIPATTPLGSISLHLGSDNANYYNLSVTQGFLGAWTAGDFVITAFDLSLATTVGSPVITAMDYVRLTFTHTATMTNVRVGNLFIALPFPNKIFFESTAIFQSGGVLSNFITNNNDNIVLNDAAYNIYEHECAKAVAFQNGGTLASGTISTINAALNGARARNGTIIEFGLYDLYRADNPSEELRQVGNYYDDQI